MAAPTPVPLCDTSDMVLVHRYYRHVAGEAEREAVAAPVDRIRVALDAHLGAEEANILPVAAATMTQQEWGRLEKVASSGVPLGRQVLMLGWMIDALGPDDGAVFVRTALPAPFRLAWSLVGARRFAAYKRRLVGAA